MLNLSFIFKKIEIYSQTQISTFDKSLIDLFKKKNQNKYLLFSCMIFLALFS